MRIIIILGNNDYPACVYDQMYECGRGKRSMLVTVSRHYVPDFGSKGEAYKIDIRNSTLNEQVQPATIYMLLTSVLWSVNTEAGPIHQRC